MCFNILCFYSSVSQDDDCDFRLAPSQSDMLCLTVSVVCLASQHTPQHPMQCDGAVARRPSDMCALGAMGLAMGLAAATRQRGAAGHTVTNTRWRIFPAAIFARTGVGGEGQVGRSSVGEGHGHEPLACGPTRTRGRFL